MSQPANLPIGVAGSTNVRPTGAHPHTSEPRGLGRLSHQAPQAATRLAAQLRCAQATSTRTPPNRPDDGKGEQSKRNKVRLLEPPEIHRVEPDEGDRELADRVQPQVEREELAVLLEAPAQAPEDGKDDQVPELLVEERRLVRHAELRRPRYGVEIDDAPGSVGRSAKGVARDEAAEAADRLAEHQPWRSNVEEAPHRQSLTACQHGCRQPTAQDRAHDRETAGVNCKNL